MWSERGGKRREENERTESLARGGTCRSISSGVLTSVDPENAVIARSIKLSNLVTQEELARKKRKLVEISKQNAAVYSAKCDTKRNVVNMVVANRIQRQMLAICAWKSLWKS